MSKKAISALLAVVMTLSIVICGAQGKPAAAETVKQAPSVQAMVDAGTLPDLEDRLPTADDVYVELDNPAENPVYGGTMRTHNNGKWYFGPVTEEPLFRLEADGTVSPNVAKSYEISEDGLTYTIHLREGMKWSDGTPFTATDVVYYYNYILVTDVNNETGEVTNSSTGCFYNWYMTTDPETGFLRPAQVRYVDDTTLTISIYSPKANLLQAICIDNKWMFCPKEWYKDIQAFDSSKPHWSGVSDLKLVGGDGLVDLTEEQAVANAKARNPLDTYEDYHMLGRELCYYYWQHAGRPTLRPWVITSPLTEETLVFERNPYFWKVDTEGRQLPYVDTIEFVGMDRSLLSQEISAGHLDFQAFSNDELTNYMAASAAGIFSVKLWSSANWTSWGLELNQTYKDPQYAELFANIDFRHALSIATNRDDLNNIIFNGLSTPAQCAPVAGSAEYIPGAPEKWVELDVDGANALLDGIPSISKSTELNADGLRTFVDGANAGKPIVLAVETCGNEADAKTIALLNTYYKKVGIQVVEISNTDNNARDEKLFLGNEAMLKLGATGTFSTMLRPDAVAANRNQVCWTGLYGLEHKQHVEPAEGTPMAEMVNATRALIAATTMEELQAAAKTIVQNHADNTWIIGFVTDSDTYVAVNNRIQNFPEGVTWCDELRYLGYGKPYTWFIQE